MPPRKKQNRRNRDAAVAPTVNCVLPRKIIMSILSRLPVKSLVRFKGVCKQWKSLVTDQDFIKLHYDRFSEAPKTWSANSQLLDCRKLGLIPRKKNPDMDDQSRPGDFILETCMGLILLARPRTTDRLILWNPATRLWKVLPNPTTRHQGTAEISSVGFGCNEEGDDHKVVRIHCIKGERMKVHVEVYSSKSDSWETVNVGFAFRPDFISQEVEVGGDPYWVVQNERDEMGLLRFDSTKMLFETIKYPMEEEEPMVFVDVFGHVGALHCRKTRNDWLEGINVWAYEYAEWIIKWSIEGGGLRELQVKYCADYSWKKCKIAGRCMDGSMFEYDAKKNRVRVLGAERGARGLMYVYAFEESLAHVRGMAALDLATPVADGDDEIKECILEGFFTWIMPLFGAPGQVQVYYPLGF